ncbi:MAG: hypothetical protein QXP01_08200, partial [Candidatus Hadarchaeum sp.]
MSKISNPLLRSLLCPTGIFSLLYLLVCIVCAVFADQLAPYDPRDPGQKDIQACLHGPSTKHLLGTDSFGTDLLSSIIYGTRVA